MGMSPAEWIAELDRLIEQLPPIGELTFSIPTAQVPAFEAKFGKHRVAKADVAWQRRRRGR